MGVGIVIIIALPVVVTLLSIPIFGFVVQRLGLTAFVGLALLSVGFWAYSSGAYLSSCQTPSAGAGDNGCGFVSFLVPMTKKLYGATALGAAIAALFTVWRLEKRSKQNG